MNWYNQVPHPNQDNLWESDKSTRKRHIQKPLEVSSQGRCHVFESGPTEEIIQCRRGQEAYHSTLSLVGFGGLSE